MQNTIIYTILDKEFLAIPFSESISFNGEKGGDRVDLHISDGIFSRSTGRIYLSNGRWVCQCVSGIILINGKIYNQQEQTVLNDLSIIYLCDSDGTPIRSKFIIFQNQAQEILNWKSVEKDNYPDDLSQLAEVDCSIINNKLVISNRAQVIYREILETELLDNVEQNDDNLSISNNDKNLYIDIHDVTIVNSMKRKTILKDIKVELIPGEMVLVLGGSGAGKTTFMEAVTGLVNSNSKVYYKGFDLLKSNQIHQIISLAPQLPDEHYRMEDSVYNNLDDAAKLYGTPIISENSKARKQKILSVLEKLDLNSVRKSKCSSLSGGQKKKLTIALEYITDPDIFFMDEPDSGVDGSMVKEVMLNLRQITDEGKILCIITHTPDRISHLFDKVIVIGKTSRDCGELCYFGSVNEALSFFEVSYLEDIVQKISGVENTVRVDEYVKKFERERNSVYV